MAEVKKISLKYVVLAFVIAVAFILLLSVDQRVNQPPEEELIAVEEQLGISIDPVTTKEIYEVQDGDNLSIILEDFEIPFNTIFKIIRKDTNQSVRNIRPGDKVVFSYNANTVNTIEIIKDSQEVLLISIADEITIQQVQKTIDLIPTSNFGMVESSFYRAAMDANIPDSIIMDFAYIFGWDVDFVFDVRKGDQFWVSYETEYIDGDQVSNGDIAFAAFLNQGKLYIAQRFIDENQGKQYFDDQGNNVRKAFLRAPLDFAYISSHFNPNRMHPILHKIKAHNGVDYAAKRNTPVMASGDGVISFAGWKSGYGKTLEIRHGGDITTLYAHLENFEKNIKQGSKVSQGDLIAFVGDSGLATAPHLHYEFRVGKKRTDPVKVKLPNAQSISSNQKAEFLLEVESNLQAALAQMPNLALSDRFSDL
jgi:murein DD-endopeptidase MepM/ murein hydrolase activator NlpD